MYENHIEMILSNNKITRESFIGAFALDEIPQINNYPVCLIINTNKREIDEIGHWIALYIDQNKYAYFFDSYGQAPSYFNLENYIKENSSKYIYNQSRLQGNKPYCGLYSIYFLLFILSNNNFFNLFDNDLESNDKKILELFKIKYLIK
jgi:hypothetical protein